MRRFWRRRGPWLLLSAAMLGLTGVLTLLQAFPRVDRMLQDNARAAMQAYLDWEYGLVEQLRRDGTHGFYVI